MRNPFKNKFQREVFGLMIDLARDTTSELYIDGVRRTFYSYGASHRQSFWNGFDHKKGGHIPPSAGAKSSAGWACFRAGQAFKKESS
jgi:hypothetical protein